MVASAVFITDLSGKSIISRNYRGDVPLSGAIDNFSKYLSDTPDEHKKPIFYHPKSSNEYVTEEDVEGAGADGETFVYINVRIASCIICVYMYIYIYISIIQRIEFCFRD